MTSISGKVTPESAEPTSDRWKSIDLDRVPLGHYVAFAGDLTPVAHAAGRRRVRELSWILGCMHPLVVPMTKLKRPSDPLCSCCDS